MKHRSLIRITLLSSLVWTCQKKKKKKKDITYYLITESNYIKTCLRLHLKNRVFKSKEFFDKNFIFKLLSKVGFDHLKVLLIFLLSKFFFFFKRTFEVLKIFLSP
jgi:hypothetical protein